MKAPRVIVELDENGNVKEDFKTEPLNRAKSRMIALESENKESGDTESAAEEDQGIHRILKRQTAPDLQIEVAVFIDNAMFNTVKDQNPGGDTIQEISDIVFAIMNGVIIYI